MTKTGQCGYCRAINSLTALDCLDCKRELPWADQVRADRAAAAAAAPPPPPPTPPRPAPRTAPRTAPRPPATPDTTYPPSPAPGYPPPSSPPGDILPINYFEIYFGSFFGRLSIAAQRMDATSALFLGLACCVAYNACVVGGIHLILQSIQNLLMGFLGNFGTGGSPITPGGGFNPFTPPAASNTNQSLSLEQIYKLLAVAFTPWFAIIVSCLLVRKIFSQEERPAGGEFLTAGMTLLPMGIFVLAAGILGMGNWEAIGLAFVICATYAVMFLYQGLVILLGIRSTAAATCTPLVLLLSAWLTKLVFTRMVGF